MGGEVMSGIPGAYRPDCKDRADAIIDTLTGIEKLSLIDIGCHNGYFMHRFLERGGGSAVGVEPNDPQYAEAINCGLNVFRSIDLVTGQFNVALYLDLHYHNGADYISWIKQNCSIAFISSSGSGQINNPVLEADLSNNYQSVKEVISTNWAGRMIYRCEEPK